MLNRKEKKHNWAMCVIDFFSMLDWFVYLRTPFFLLCFHLTTLENVSICCIVIHFVFQIHSRQIISV